MNLHPRIKGTVALWQFQGDIKDYSGLGNHLASVDPTTHASKGGLQFVSVSNKVNGVVTNDGCLQAVDLCGNDYTFGAMPVLMGPLAPTLQLVGPVTFEWIMFQKQTFTGTYICCANPAGRSGGGAPDRIGSLYTLYWSAAENAAIGDQFISGSTPYSGYGNFTGATIATWAETNTPSLGDWSAHHRAYVRDASGNWTIYQDGAVLAPGVLSAGTNVAVGNEQVFIGLCEAGSDGGTSCYASMRIVNYARSATQIAADASFVLGGCGAVPQPPVIDASAAMVQPPSVVMAADVGRYYRLQPGHMPQLKG